MSSLDTSSVDDDLGIGTRLPSSLSDLGGTSSLTYAGSAAGAASIAGTQRSGGESVSVAGTHRSGSSADTGLQSSYSELNQAMEKGDWAAVGVTAAFIVSQSVDSGSHGEVERPELSTSAMTPQRAAELNMLVEAGDWEGVFKAAAKYDSQDVASQEVGSRGGSSGVASSGGESTGSHSNRSSAGSAGSTGTGPSAFSGSSIGRSAYTSNYSTVSESTSRTRVQKLQEIRAEVETLVETVCPEEKDNVDEMLQQFRGREDELVETLRSMQERAVAQKARVEGQKRAKRDARQTIEEKANESPTKSAALDSTSSPADENWMKEIESTPSDGKGATKGLGRLGIDQLEPPQEADEDKEIKDMHDTLQEAIKNENWDVVAETASGLRYVDDSSTSTSRSGRTSDSDRSQKLNALVERGDWEGVVAAASQFNEADRSTGAGGTEAIEERRARREKRLQEEEEALAQADIWNAIAEQAKGDTDDANAAAKVAADWAIARSFSALKKATDDGKLQGEADTITSDGGSKAKESDNETNEDTTKGSL